MLPKSDTDAQCSASLSLCGTCLFLAGISQVFITMASQFLLTCKFSFFLLYNQLIKSAAIVMLHSNMLLSAIILSFITAQFVLRARFNLALSSSCACSCKSSQATSPRKKLLIFSTYREKIRHTCLNIKVSS